jgi:hypothetical protein
MIIGTNSPELIALPAANAAPSEYQPNMTSRGP